MKVIRNNKHIKTVPAKFKEVVKDFHFISPFIRLSESEREILSCLLAESKVKQHIIYTFKQSLTDACLGQKIESVSRVLKRGEGVHYRCKMMDKLEFKVPYHIICDYPKHLIINKNEF